MDAKPLRDYTPKQTNSDTHEWSVAITGDVVQVSARFLIPPCRLPGIRRPCKEFSNASRRAMLKTVSRIDWNNVHSGLFVTLTFPDKTLPMDAYRRNQARYVFFRSIETHVQKNVSALWRVEWKARRSGALVGQMCPHFHLIIFSVPFIPYKKINLWWKTAIAWTGTVSTDVQSLKDKRHHAVYIAKYAAKRPETNSLDSLSNLNIDGRHWGIHRRSLLPKHRTVVYDGLNDFQIEQLKQVGYDEFPTWYGEYAELGYTAFGLLGEKLKNRVREICLDVGDASE